ncbi:uncharacterized protein LOC126901560 isoform X2 [Daktulosphaira vitifoliae]|uniref:uncharacterized protein LOC126901560 isoform X2 n=1 Tax=Daktulosphaira vitifoliae TaxID=58002 RepID=UPI0021A9D1DA|nr:uncharacterized protein LOC126901560 isoform X2 [Daktulosphaira vitifoliae]
MYNKIVLIFCFVCTFITYIDASSSSSNTDHAIKLFKLLNKETTDTINFDEFKTMMSIQIKLKDEELLEMFNKYKLNENQKMSFTEFNKFLDDTMEGDITEDDYTEVFKAFDSNNDGKISVDELHVILLGINPHQTMKNTKDALNTYDKDENGFICLEETNLRMSPIIRISV